MGGSVAGFSPAAARGAHRGAVRNSPIPRIPAAAHKMVTAEGGGSAGTGTGTRARGCARLLPQEPGTAPAGRELLTAALPVALSRLRSCRAGRGKRSRPRALPSPPADPALGPYGCRALPAAPSLGSRWSQLLLNAWVKE